MKIPMGNFGNVVAEPQRQAQFSNAAGQAIGQGLSDLGRAAGGIAQDMQQAELQKQRSQASMTLATISNRGYDLNDEIARDVNDGKLPAAQAVPEFRKRMGQVVGESTKDLTADQRMIIDEHLIKSNGMHERNLNGVAIKRTQNEIGANLLGMGEQFQRAAMRDLPGSIAQFGKSVDTMGPEAGWSPEKIAQVKQGFVEGATFNLANATLEGAAQTGDLGLVVAAREKIQGPDGEPIDPARRTALITKAYAFENGIKASTIRDIEKQKREQEAKENKAFDAYTAASTLQMEGRYFSTDYINNLSTVTAGTAMAPAVQELVKTQTKFAGFASYPLAQQTAEIERLRAAGSTRGAGTSPDEEKFVDQLERIRDAGQKAYAENPWTAAQDRGVIQRAPEIELTDMNTASAVLAARMQQIGAVEAAAGRKVSPLQPQEAETIGRLVRMLPPDQQSNALATVGKAVGDGDRLAALAKQIDDKDKVLGTAMMVGDLQTTQGRYVSELVLKGSRALKDKSIMVDSAKETGWRGAIANEIGDAFPNQEVRDRMIEAAYLVQAGFAAENSGTDVKRAIRLVAGEIVEHNGSKIPLPRAMDESTFEKRLSSITPANLAAQTPGGTVLVGKTAVKVADFVNSLPDAALVSAGQGRYNIRAGMGLVTNAKGQRITIEVRNGN